MRTRLVALIAASALIAPGAGHSQPLGTKHLVNAGVHADVGPDTITLSNGIVERTWDAKALTTLSVGRVGSPFTTPHDDFSLDLHGFQVDSDLFPARGMRIGSSAFPIQFVETSATPEGARITWTLGWPGAVQLTRTVEAYAGIAGFKSQTTISSAAPLALSGYSLDEVDTTDPSGYGDAGTATVHAFRAGSDWRFDDGWSPTGVGDPHLGDWRADTSSQAPVSAPGEWLSATTGNGQHIAMVSERRDYASSRMSYDGIASAQVDLSRDIDYIGPFEQDAHAENPGPGPARHRLVVPGEPLALEPAFTMFGADVDDEAWQFFKYLTQHEGQSYPKRVMFNSDGVDNNAISTGSKDDMNFARFQAILPAVRAMGLDTFIFDDGWQAASGDWCADAPTCPEPRNAGDPVKYAPRFPDDHFAAVQQLLKGDPNDPTDDVQLGLWMNPMEFHPASTAFKMNPQWACAPVGDGLAAYNAAQPDSGSNEPGIGVWNPLAWGLDPDTGAPTQFITYLQHRIEREIEVYGARYFKFDFLAWTDCGGAYPVDQYQYHDAFVNMLDAVEAEHPEVTFSIDETNDYRMFPYESTVRGPAWFQNGGPRNADLLHSVWDLSPYVPGFSLGQRSFARDDERKANIDMVLASSLPGHITFSMPVDTSLTDAERAETRKWVDFYHANSSTLAGMTYPLLEDPVAKTWTALQSWDGDSLSGWLLAYKLGGSDTSKTIALRGLGRLDGATGFHLTQVDPATGSSVDLGVHTASELRDAGVDVGIAGTTGYAIVKIERA